MARATITATRKTGAAARKPAPKQAPGRKTAVSKPPAGKAQKAAPAKRAAPRAASLAPKPNKEELRVQVEKLERANITLRKKNRELKRAADEAGTRVAELEAAVARHEQRAARASPPVPASAKPARAVARKRAQPAPASEPAERDPGDAVPPGVAVEQPGPLSESDQKVLDHLNEESSSG